MKLKDLIMEQKQKGTYAGVRYDTETNKALHKYISENKIPNAIRPDKIHTTLLYSRKFCPNYSPLGAISPPWQAKPMEFTSWNARKPDGSTSARCLILKLDAPQLVERHLALMKEHDATYDFAVYEPHLTLSYDIGDMDYKSLPKIFNSVEHLNVVEEYGEDLDLDWAQTKGVKKGG